MATQAKRIKCAACGSPYAMCECPPGAERAALERQKGGPVERGVAIHVELDKLETFVASRQPVPKVKFENPDAAWPFKRAKASAPQRTFGSKEVNAFLAGMAGKGVLSGHGASKVYTYLNDLANGQDADTAAGNQAHVWAVLRFLYELEIPYTVLPGPDGRLLIQAHLGDE